MIVCEKLNGSKIVINAELIELIEETPDILITLQNGKKLMVKDTIQSIIEKVIAYKREVYSA